MYTQKMADENKAMLERAKELLVFYESSSATGSVKQLYDCMDFCAISLEIEFPGIDESRVRRWVNKANRELRNG